MSINVSLNPLADCVWISEIQAFLEQVKMLRFTKQKLSKPILRYVITTSHTALVFSSAVNILIYFYKVIFFTD